MTDHSLNDCRAFSLKTYEERKKLLIEHGYCFRCCDSTEHQSRDCKAMNIKCATCQSSRHSTLLHNANFNYEGNLVSHQALVGGERLAYQKEQVSSKCTQICGNGFSGKSCAKTILVNVYPKGQRHNAVKMYAIFDDQSNRTLAQSDFFQSFNINTSEVEYSLSSCAGKLVTSGKTAHGYIIESFDGLLQLDLPTILE